MKLTVSLYSPFTPEADERCVRVYEKEEKRKKLLLKCTLSLFVAIVSFVVVNIHEHRHTETNEATEKRGYCLLLPIQKERGGFVLSNRELTQERSNL